MGTPITLFDPAVDTGNVNAIGLGVRSGQSTGMGNTETRNFNSVPGTSLLETRGPTSNDKRDRLIAVRKAMAEQRPPSRKQKSPVAPKETRSPVRSPVGAKSASGPSWPAKKSSSPPSLSPPTTAKHSARRSAARPGSARPLTPKSSRPSTPKSSLKSPKLSRKIGPSKAKSVDSAKQSAASTAEQEAAEEIAAAQSEALLVGLQALKLLLRTLKDGNVTGDETGR